MRTLQERLRDTAYALPSEGGGKTIGDDWFPVNICTESADHIDKLAQALREMLAIVDANAERIGYAKGSAVDKQIRAARSVLAKATGQ